MLDLGFIEANAEAVRENCRNRKVDADVDLVLKLAGQRRRLASRLQSVRERQKEISRQTQKAADAKSREEHIATGRALKAEAAALEDELRKAESQLLAAQRGIPNMTHPDSPIGSDEEDNVERERVGEPPRFDFAPRDHLELGRLLDIIDFESGTKVAGRDFYFLKGAAAVMEMGLLHYGLEVLLGEGFTPYVTPDVATLEILDGIGYNPRGEETQIYTLAGTDLGLIATAEVTLGGMLKDTVLDEGQLPLKICGLSHCFRRESGTYGRASRGLYRVHQFSKLEMFVYAAPDQSAAMLDELVRI